MTDSNTSQASSPSDAKYPTPEEILAGLYVPTEAEVSALRYWKSNYFDGGAWKKLGKSDRIAYLKRLISDLNSEGRGASYRWSSSSEYSYLHAYEGNAPIISVDADNPSIISALHELGHHLFGSDELEACRYAIGMFKAGFPNAFDRLSWKGHLLVKAG